MAESVVQASRRTEALLASLLILARGQRGLARRAPVDLAEAAAGAVAAARDAAGARGRAALGRRSQPATVEGDAALLERLVANLIENGVRYNRPGGYVEVLTRSGDRHGRAAGREQRAARRPGRRAAARRAVRAPRPRGRRARRRARACRSCAR